MEENKPISLEELWAQNAESILQRLVQELKETGGPAYQRTPSEVLETRIQRLFDAFWEAVLQKDPKPMTDYVWAASRQRGHEGFSVAELQNVALRLREALLDVVDEVYADYPELHLRNSRQVEELILTGISAGVRGFVDGREALIARQYDALRRGKKAED
jgi:hypothetical protein